MVVSREENPAIQVQDDDSKKSWLQKMSRMVSVQSSKTKRFGDILVTLIALPLLITCSVMLHLSMRSNWVKDHRMRWRILGLGLSLLFVSLLVCFYATHRLGLCIWKSQTQPIPTSNRIRRRTVSTRGGLPSPLVATDSEMHLMVRGELPPSYDSVMSYNDHPPPYSTVIIQDEKTEISRSLDAPCFLQAVSPGTG